MLSEGCFPHATTEGRALYLLFADPKVYMPQVLLDTFPQVPFR